VESCTLEINRDSGDNWLQHSLICGSLLKNWSTPAQTRICVCLSIRCLSDFFTVAELRLFGPTWKKPIVYDHDDQLLLRKPSDLDQNCNEMGQKFPTPRHLCSSFHMYGLEHTVSENVNNSLRGLSRMSAWCSLAVTNGSDVHNQSKVLTPTHSRVFLYFYYVLHCRIIVKTSKLWNNTLGII
jgi:hypothetical protein